MAWLAVDANGTELIFSNTPERMTDIWLPGEIEPDCVELPTGSIKKLTGKVMTWDDEPFELD